MEDERRKIDINFWVNGSRWKTSPIFLWIRDIKFMSKNNPWGSIHIYVNNMGWNDRNFVNLKKKMKIYILFFLDLRSLSMDKDEWFADLCRGGWKEETLNFWIFFQPKRWWPPAVVAAVTVAAGRCEQRENENKI